MVVSRLPSFFPLFFLLCLNLSTSTRHPVANLPYNYPITTLYPMESLNPYPLPARLVPHIPRNGSTETKIRPCPQSPPQGEPSRYPPTLQLPHSYPIAPKKKNPPTETYPTATLQLPSQPTLHLPYTFPPSLPYISRPPPTLHQPTNPPTLWPPTSRLTYPIATLHPGLTVQLPAPKP